MQNDHSRRWFLGLGAAWSAALVACRSNTAAPAAEPRSLGAAVSPVRVTIEIREDRAIFQPEHQGTAGGSVESNAAARNLRHHHALVAALRATPLRRPRDRPVGAHADDPWSRRSSARVQRRRAEAPAVDLAHSFSRVLRQQRRRVARGIDRVRRAAHPRPDQLQASGPAYRSRRF